MTRRLRQNFSRLHAAVLQTPDRNRAVIVETLGKLGPCASVRSIPATRRIAKRCWQALT